MRKVKTVLLVDDDQVTNLLNNKIIKKVKLASKVDVALNGKEAISYLERVEKTAMPDVIFLDINMPEMNGFEFLEAYKEKFKDNHDSLILMMLTSTVNEDDLKKARAYGTVQEFISKPLTVAKLNEIMVKLSLQGIDSN